MDISVDPAFVLCLDNWDNFLDVEFFRRRKEFILQMLE